MEQQRSNLILRMYPMTKLTFVACISLSVFFVPGYVYALSCFVLLLLLALASGTFKPFLSMLSKTIFVLVALMFVMQALFYPGEHILWQWSIFSIKLEGIFYALTLSSKLLVIGGSIILFFKTTTIKDFVSALEQTGVSKTFTYVILATLQIIPQMEKRSKVIMDAQRSRGVETEGNLFVRMKAFIPSIGPLILGSIVGTEERAITLEARAFSVGTKAVRMHTVQQTVWDRRLRYLFIVLLLGLIVARGVRIWI